MTVHFNPRRLRGECTTRLESIDCTVTVCGGNPRGSRKRARTLGAAVAAALDEKVDVKENGRSRRITKLEAAAKQLVNRAANGDQRAMQLVARLIEADDRRPAPQVPTYTSEGDALVVSEIVRRLTRPRQ